MIRNSKSLALTCLGLLVPGLCWVPAEARPLRVVTPARQGVWRGPHVPGAGYFVPMQADMVEAYPIIGANADGSDLWPCVGNTDSPSADCPTIGNPQINLPYNAIVTGFPGYGWTLQNNPNHGNGTGCDALVNGTGPQGVPYKPCAQITTWYDDDTNDSTDDLLWRVRAVQNGNIIYDTGTLDFGPAGPSVRYPVHVLLANDTNFGYWPGANVGPNNGNCSGDINYPLTAPAFPPGYYEVESGKTCVEPTAGAIKVITETALATPSYHKVIGDACTAHGVPSPCYTVTWAKKSEIHQNFSALLE